MTTIFAILLLVAVSVSVVSIVVTLISGAGEDWRRGIIQLAEAATVTYIAVSTIAGGLLLWYYPFLTSLVAQYLNEWVAKYSTEPLASVSFDQSERRLIAVGIGALCGFLSSALLSAPFLTLTAIEANTRRSTAILEAIALEKFGIKRPPSFVEVIGNFFSRFER